MRAIIDWILGSHDVTRLPDRTDGAGKRVLSRIGPTLAVLKDWQLVIVAMLGSLGTFAFLSVISSYLAVFCMTGVMSSAGGMEYLAFGYGIMIVVLVLLAPLYLVFPAIESAHLRYREHRLLPLCRAVGIAVIFVSSYQWPSISPDVYLASYFVVMLLIALVDACLGRKLRPSEQPVRIFSGIAWHLGYSVTMLIWMVVWLVLANAMFDPTAKIYSSRFLYAVCAAGGAIYYIAGRLGGPKVATFLAICLSFALFAETPTFLRLVRTSLYMINAGGGRTDLNHSKPGLVICDLGAFNEHFLVRAGPAGCTDKYAAEQFDKLLLASEDKLAQIALEMRWIEPAAATAPRSAGVTSDRATGAVVLDNQAVQPTAPNANN